MPVAAPRTGDSNTGLMTPAPVTAGAPACHRCTWVATTGGRFVIKLVHRSCEDHYPGAVPWSWERFRAWRLA
jgi:hypothetical protein